MTSTLFWDIARPVSRPAVYAASEAARAPLLGDARLASAMPRLDQSAAPLNGATAFGGERGDDRIEFGGWLVVRVLEGLERSDHRSQFAQIELPQPLGLAGHRSQATPTLVGTGS